MKLKNLFLNVKKNEDSEGYIKQSFFNLNNSAKFEFISGPFANFIFNTIEENNISIKGRIGKYKIFVSKEKNLFRPA